MINWIIKLLGGYTFDEYDRKDQICAEIARDYYALKDKLKQARKNDTPRDPKTERFVKK